MSFPTPLSVVIITFNEERNIGRCLDSIKKIADDVVVVDSFSTDNTQEICDAKGARFVSNPFEGHIQQKNYAVTQAKYPFILSLDADEAPDEELIAEILAAKKNPEFSGYTMNRLTNYCGKWIRHCGWYPDTKLRLWDSTQGHWTGFNPHDRYELFDKNAPVKHLKGNILHYSYYSVREHYRQADKFSTIAAREAYLRGKKSGVMLATIKSWAKFIRNYIINAGFLDGKYGYIICRITAYETWQKYMKLLELRKIEKR
ncbi:MAG TPA: glycosyltransferase family 2 protein [Bacteroidia bacterium]|nr:glycosyltransferase family 2 protein [Bacteroidia bacterium]